MNKEIRVFIVDDHPIVRDGLRRIVESDPGMVFAGESGDGEDAIKLILENACDVVLLDISLQDPQVDGIKVMKRCLQSKPALKIIFITLYEEDQYAVRLMRMGANGFIHKTSNSNDLLAAIRKVFRGGYYYSDKIADKLIAGNHNGASDGNLHDSLSEREFQILSMIGKRMTPAEIADSLNISRKTVSTHQANMVAKLHLKRNVDLLHYAIVHKISN